MSHESFERNIAREEVLDALWTRGLNDAEARELLGAYHDQEHERAERIGTNRANMECELGMARLYADAGFPRELIRDHLNDLRLTIANDFRSDYSDILVAIELLENALP